MEIKKITPSDWENLLAAAPDRTPFHSRNWLEFLMVAWPSVKVEFLALEEGGRLLAILPLVIKKRFGLTLAGSPLRGMFTPYLGPLVMETDRLELQLLLKELQRFYSMDFFEMSLTPGKNLALPGKTDALTVIVDLSGEETTLWKKLKKNTRNQVRKAKKTGVGIDSPQSENQWVAGYTKLVTATFARQGMRAPAGEYFYRLLWRRLTPKGMLKILLAHIEDSIVAGGIYLLGDKTVYGLDGAMDRRFQNARPNNLIEWETIAWGNRKGFFKYDMMGANIPSIAKFKMGFGGEQHSYGKYQTETSFRGKIAWKFYKRYGTRIKKYTRF